MKSPLFDPACLINDLFIHRLPALAQLFLFKLMALADMEGGYVRRSGMALSLEKIAALLGVDAAEARGHVGAIMDMGWIGEDETGFFIPAMKARAALREKRRRAGAKGGQATTAQRSDVCSSNVVSFDKSKTSTKPAKKEKVTQKEKNNKIIYILGKAVDTSTRGTAENPLAFDGKVIKLHRLERAAIAEQLKLPLDDLYDMLDRQDEWLAGQDDKRRRAWLPLTLHSLKYQAGARRAA